MNDYVYECFIDFKYSIIPHLKIKRSKLNKIQHINQFGLGYEEENIFHIPNHSKLVQFLSARFLDENSKTPNVNGEDVQVVDDKIMEEVPKCQHCHII